MRKRAISGFPFAVTGGGAGIGAAIAARDRRPRCAWAIGDLDKAAAATRPQRAIGGRSYRLDVTDEDSFTKFSPTSSPTWAGSTCSSTTPESWGRTVRRRAAEGLGGHGRGQPARRDPRRTPRSRNTRPGPRQIVTIASAASKLSSRRVDLRRHQTRRPRLPDRGARRTAR